MRTYVVQPGDSPAKIAAEFGGCPKCARDLVAVNPHKKSRTLPNGFVTFETLHVGEVLNLPDIWLGDNDTRPPEYFKALPYADGVTRGVGAPSTQQDDSMSAGEKLGIAVVAAAAIIGITYAATESLRHA